MTKIFEDVVDELFEEYNKIPNSLSSYNLNTVFDHTKEIKEYPVGGYPKNEIPKQLQIMEDLDLIKRYIVHIKILEIEYYYNGCKQFLNTKEIVVFVKE